MSHTTPSNHRARCIPATRPGLCEAAAEGDAGKGTFTTGLSATGEPPAISTTSAAARLLNEFGDLLPLTSFDEEGAPTTRPGDVATVEAIADLAGITAAAGTIAALFAAIDVDRARATSRPWRGWACRSCRWPRMMAVLCILIGSIGGPAWGRPHLVEGPT